MFGWGYAKDVCIALYEQEKKNEYYREYVAECLRMISENTARKVGGVYMPVKFTDVISPKARPKQEPGQATERIREKLR